ncbi:MAG: hypothetical protein WBX00_14990, partial [Isosphaeraceae bacterium]
SWSLARTLAARLGSDDVVYCLDADMGLPLAGAFRRATSRPKQAVFLHNLDRPRGRLAAKLAWMPMQKKKPNRIAGLLAFFPR